MKVQLLLVMGYSLLLNLIRCLSFLLLLKGGVDISKIAGF